MQPDTNRLPRKSLIISRFDQGAIDAGRRNLKIIRPDIVHVNMVGHSKVFLSIKGENHFLKVKLPDTVRSLGAEVSVKTESGKVLKQLFLPGKGLCSDSSHVLFFGLAKEKATDA